MTTTTETTDQDTTKPTEMTPTTAERTAAALESIAVIQERMTHLLSRITTHLEDYVR